jgi:hypothetical protein
MYNPENERKHNAEKDMLYGLLWFLGGLVLTIAEIGYLFWGAMLFGAIQFFKGFSNRN